MYRATSSAAHPGYHYSGHLSLPATTVISDQWYDASSRTESEKVIYSPPLVQKLTLLKSATGGKHRNHANQQDY